MASGLAMRLVNSVREVYSRLRQCDPVITVLTLVITCVGLLFIYDAGYARSMGSNRGSIPREFLMQALFAIIAGLACLVAAAVKPENWLRISKVAFYLTLAALVGVKVFGKVQNGARRWIGPEALQIQPAEFAKLAVILLLAASFADRKLWPSRIPPAKSTAHWMDQVFVPKFRRCWPGFMVALCAVLIEQEPDMGTAAVVATVGLYMLIVGRVSWKSIAVGLAIAGCLAVYTVNTQSYRLGRILVHSRRWDKENVMETTYQTVQSELGMAYGGWKGVGMGGGRAKHMLPATTTDFIMATIAEESGAIGAIALLGLLGALVWRLFVCARKAPTEFGCFVLYGVGGWIGIQSCVNFMMANAFLPAIGIPLPFISSGGSSLIALGLAIGVSQSVLREFSPVVETAPKPKKAPRRAPHRNKRTRSSSEHARGPRR